MWAFMRHVVRMCDAFDMRKLRERATTIGWAVALYIYRILILRVRCHPRVEIEIPDDRDNGSVAGKADGSLGGIFSSLSTPSNRISQHELRRPTKTRIVIIVRPYCF